MTDSDFLLTEEYQVFSDNVRRVFEAKKTLEVDFKKKFEEYKKQKTVFEQQAQSLSDEWESWKNDQLGKPKQE